MRSPDIVKTRSAAVVLRSSYPKSDLSTFFSGRSFSAMKFTTALATLLLVLNGFSTGFAQTTRYWDTNDTAAGATTAGFADGTWNASNTLWNTDPTGGAGGAVTGWTSPLDNAVFSAGSDVALVPQPGTSNDNSDISAIITPSADSAAASMTFEEGTYLLSAVSGVFFTVPQTTIKAGAHVEYNLTTVYPANFTGKITLQGGELENNNPGNAGAFVKSTMQLEVDGTGIIRYDDASFRLSNSSDCNCSIYNAIGTGAAILGAGGTVDNGGAGTLIKRGAGEIRYNGTGQPLTTYAKLRVEEGLFRLGFTSPTQDERGFGAAPLAPLADAITLDGGYIGHSLNPVTLHANRGITIGPNGGGWAGGTVTIPAPISGTGLFSIIGGQVTLGNATNNTTFSGKLNIENGTLVVASDNHLGAAPGSPVADQISMGGISPLLVNTTGTLNFSATTILNANRGITIANGGTGRINVPTGGNTVTYDGAITGPGKFIKMGDGTLATGGAHGYAGGTDIYGRLIVNGTSTGTGAMTVKTLSATLGTNGTLAGTGTVSAPVTVESGAHIAPGNNGIGTLSVAGLTLNSGSILDFDLGANPSGDLVSVTGTDTLTVSGGTINLTNAGGLSNGTYKLIDYNGTALSGASFANLTLGTQPAGFTFALVNNTAGTSVDLSVTGAVVGVQGDYNNNGVVDAADYVVWRNGGPLQNEVTGVTPGTVTPEDYDAWRGRFGNNSGSGAGAVPEPTSIVLVFAGLVGLSLTGRRSR